MKNSEVFARFLVIMICAAAVIVPLATRLAGDTIAVHAKMAENGGWNPEVIQARVGEPLRLNLTSDDVLHGFAVGKLDLPSVEIQPGKVTPLQLTFNTPGTYTYYCTRWCGINHWRMRGQIEVLGDKFVGSDDAQEPPYVTLKLDIDQPHPAQVTPEEIPSARAGNDLRTSSPEVFSVIESLLEPDQYLAISPADAYQKLRGEPGMAGLTDQQIWDLVAYIWQRNATPAGLREGAQLYQENCAACHGESGAGDGVFSHELETAGQVAGEKMAGSHSSMRQAPVNFTDSGITLGASPALLHGKILRGGMGTGMPMWGAILTEEQIWNLVSYLYLFTMEIN